jgi:hypothetical protein
MTITTPTTGMSSVQTADLLTTHLAHHQLPTLDVALDVHRDDR